jgi:hypothetical protein
MSHPPRAVAAAMDARKSLLFFIRALPVEDLNTFSELQRLAS